MVANNVNFPILPIPSITRHLSLCVVSPLVSIHPARHPWYHSLSSPRGLHFCTCNPQPRLLPVHSLSHRGQEMISNEVVHLDAKRTAPASQSHRHLSIESNGKGRRNRLVGLWPLWYALVPTENTLLKPLLLGLHHFGSRIWVSADVFKNFSLLYH